VSVPVLSWLLSAARNQYNREEALT